MRLWRISAYPGLGGDGGHYDDGRWHTKGRAIIYVAEHPALAMIETMAHMRLNLAEIPVNLKLITITIADGAQIAPRVEVAAGWQANEPTSQAIGNAWLEAREYLLLPVPSALIAHSTNYLINPNHPQLRTHVTEASAPESFWFDKRYLR